MLNKESDEESYLDDSDNERLSGEEIFTKKRREKREEKGTDLNILLTILSMLYWMTKS